jgi:predicted amidohydrolase
MPEILFRRCPSDRVLTDPGEQPPGDALRVVDEEDRQSRILADGGLSFLGHLDIFEEEGKGEFGGGARLFGRLGFAICYDIRFPQLFRAEALAGAEVLTAPAAFTRQTGQAHWHVLQRARAIETGCFVIAPAQGGKHENGRRTFGHSLIVDPWGEILAEGGEDPGIVVADIDPAKVTEARTRVPALTHDRPFTLS